MSGKPSWELRRGDELAPGLRVLGNLGGGPRTEVYRCSSTDVGETVAVKMLRPGRCTDEDRAVLAREAAVLAQLDHPGFARLHERELHADRPRLVIEHVDGPHLSTLRREFGPLEPEQLLPLARDIAAALAHLHGHGWVHLDVKARNIVMGPRPVLLDLGTAREITSCPALPPRFGTLSTMAPEQVAPGRFGPVGPAADVFGLGVAIAVAAGASNPLRRRRDDDAPPEESLISELHAACGAIEGGLRVLVLACLALAPDDRPTTAQLAADPSLSSPTARGIVSRMAAAMRGLSDPSQGGLTTRP